MKTKALITAVIVASGFVAACKLAGIVALPWALVLSPVAIPAGLLALAAIAIATRFAAIRFAAGFRAGTPRTFGHR